MTKPFVGEEGVPGRGSKPRIAIVGHDALVVTSEAERYRRSMPFSIILPLESYLTTLLLLPFRNAQTTLGPSYQSPAMIHIIQTSGGHALGK